MLHDSANTWLQADRCVYTHRIGMGTNIHLAVLLCYPVVLSGQPFGVLLNRASTPTRHLIATYYSDGLIAYYHILLQPAPTDYHANQCLCSTLTSPPPTCSIIVAYCSDKLRLSAFPADACVPLCQALHLLILVCYSNQLRLAGPLTDCCVLIFQDQRRCTDPLFVLPWKAVLFHQLITVYRYVQLYIG